MSNPTTCRSSQKTIQQTPNSVSLVRHLQTLSSSSSSSSSSSCRRSLTADDIAQINLFLPRLFLSSDRRHLATTTKLATAALLTNPPPNSVSLSPLLSSLDYSQYRHFHGFSKPQKGFFELQFHGLIHRNPTPTTQKREGRSTAAMEESSSWSPTDSMSILLEDFGQKVDLTRRIREVLVNYPEGTTVMKELIQNADDAGATTVRLCLDRRVHASHSLLSRRSRSGKVPGARAVANREARSRSELQRT